VLASAILAHEQTIPENGVFSVAAPDYSKDAQRTDSHSCRRRCRFDVLAAAVSHLNSDPHEALWSLAKLEAVDTHTRM
jgi:hypothetical protein